MPKLAVENLRKRYGSVQAVDAVGFHIDEGEVFGLLGPNGAGKTTTIECVIGLRHADAGAIEIDGVDARTHPRDAKRKIGAALQTTQLQDKATPREALTLFGALYGAAPRAEELLETFALADKADAAFATLSGGQRQRLALALALVNAPEVIVLDEPTAGLDPSARRELHASIAHMRHEGRAVLLTTHLIDEAEKLCDRIAIIHKGRIVATGSPAALIAQSRAGHAVSLVTSRELPRERLAAVPAIDELVVSGAHVRFRTADATRALAALTALAAAEQSEIVELVVKKASLEDLFLELTGS